MNLASERTDLNSGAISCAIRRTTDFTTAAHHGAARLEQRIDRGAQRVAPMLIDRLGEADPRRSLVLRLHVQPRHFEQRLRAIRRMPERRLEMALGVGGPAVGRSRLGGADKALCRLRGMAKLALCVAETEGFLGGLEVDKRGALGVTGNAGEQHTAQVIDAVIVARGAERRQRFGETLRMHCSARGGFGGAIRGARRHLARQMAERGADILRFDEQRLKRIHRIGVCRRQGLGNGPEVDRNNLDIPAMGKKDAEILESRRRARNP